MFKPFLRKGLQFFLEKIPLSALSSLSDKLLWYRHRTQEKLRQRKARQSPAVSVELTSHHGEKLHKSVLEADAPWMVDHSLDCEIPGMLTNAEKSYYGYITQFFQGSGAVVELGPWIGMSTDFILRGLLKNPNFEGQKLFVYDDFVWRSSWMNKWLKGTDIRPLNNHDSFLPLFKQQIGGLAEHVHTQCQKIVDYDGNEALTPIRWHGDPIELIIVDCGRSLKVNEGWWSVFSESFMPDKTLIVMQDWQNYKSVPEVYWENTKIFTDEKQSALELVHEVKDGCTATFLFKGKA